MSKKNQNPQFDFGNLFSNAMNQMQDHRGNWVNYLRLGSSDWTGFSDSFCHAFIMAALQTQQTAYSKTAIMIKQPEKTVDTLKSHGLQLVYDSPDLYLLVSAKSACICSGSTVNVFSLDKEFVNKVIDSLYE